MRIFAGLPIPGEMIEKIRQVCEYLKGEYGGLKVVKSEGLHVTLHFFGEMPKHKVDELITLMNDPFMIRKKIEVSFSGFGQFPPRGNPKVIYIHIEKGGKEISAYQQLYTKHILSHGFGSLPKKKFVPHITIARNKRERLPRDFPDSIPFTFNESFVIDRCILYQSILKPTGAEYEGLKTVIFT